MRQRFAAFASLDESNAAHRDAIAAPLQVDMGPSALRARRAVLLAPQRRVGRHRCIIGIDALQYAQALRQPVLEFIEPAGDIDIAPAVVRPDVEELAVEVT